MKGYELIKEIENGNIDDCKIRWSYPGGKGTIRVEHRTLKWEPGEFSTNILTSSFATFEVIEENKEIEELKFKEGTYTGEKINQLLEQVNKLGQAVNKLIKEREEK
jgi:hypothetical protein